MQLSLRPLRDVSSVNSFCLADNFVWTEGDSLDLYFVLIDASLDTTCEPRGRRYVPSTGAVLSVQFGNIYETKKVIKIATQPFPGDLSVFMVSVASNDPIRGSPQLNLMLTEGAKVTRGVVSFAVKVWGKNNLGCNVTPPNQGFY